MFLIYVKMAWRHLMKDKVYSVITIVGLSISVAISMLVLQYARYEFHYDTFFQNASRIYRVTTDSYDNKQLVYRSALTSLSVGAALRSDIPELKEVTQLLQTGGWFTCTLKYDNGPTSKAFNEKAVFYGDGSFFRVFSWPLTTGDVQTALEQPLSVVITEATARRYFGEEEAMGKTLRLRGSSDENDYTVTGVMPDLPEDSHLKINVIFSVSSLTHNKYAGYFDAYTYFLLMPGSEPARVSSKLPVLGVKVFGKSAAEQRLAIEPIEEVHLDTRWQDEMKASGNTKSVYFLLIVAAFILVIALINYVNLSTARALERCKEVGVRKISGAHRYQLVRQFLTESFIIYLFSVLVAALLLGTLSGWFYDVVGLPPSFFFLSERTLTGTEWLTFIAFLIILFFAAFYPARMISSFSPALVLKGRFAGSPRGLILRRALVVIQFICTIGLMTGVSVMHDQHAFIQKQDLGVDIAGTMIVKAPSNLLDESCYANIPRFKRSMKELTFVASVTTSSAIPGQKIEWVGNLRKALDESVVGRNFTIQLADPDFIDSYNLKLIAGKNFDDSDFPISRRFGSKVENIVLNAEAVRQLRFASAEEAVDKVIYWDAVKCVIVGVVADYHQLSLRNPIQPTVFTANLGPDVSVKLSRSVRKENLASVLALIQKNWSAYFPDSPFDYFFLDDFYQAQYSEDEQVMKLFDVFCGVAILISCLGLFGLSLFTTKQRTKELGIRKVLGATVANLVALLIKEFLRPIVIACCIALPLAYFILQRWLNTFAFHMNMNGWEFAVPVLAVMLIAILTVSLQTARAVHVNPTETLKHE